MPCICGYEQLIIKNFRSKDRPFESLLAAEGSSGKKPHLADTEVLPQQIKTPGNIPDGDERKTMVIWVACPRILREGTCGAIRRTQTVGTHDEVFIRVDDFAGAYYSGPPFHGIGVAGEGMDYPYHIVTGSV